VLLGLLANAKINRLPMRTLTVAVCFFLAACAKESAATFPLLLFLFDWIQTDEPQDQSGLLARVRAIWQRQWPVYAAVLSAGILYLALRFAALGFLLDTSRSPVVALPAQVQTVAYTLLTYWRILVWPMTGLAPTHDVDPARFTPFSVASVSVDLAVLAMLLAGIYGTCKRNPFGYAILAVTVALLPVLHILRVQFDPSLYHERYIMLGLALALSLLPRMVDAILPPSAKLHLAAFAGGAFGLIWLSMAVVNIHATLPLWSDDTRLWQWDVLANPGSDTARNNLLANYIDHHDHVHARALADELLAREIPCAPCMINVAAAAMDEGDLTRAKTAMARAEKAMAESPNDPPTSLLQSFILVTARLRELEHDTVGADDAYHDAISMGPLDPQSQTAFALFLARQGKAAQARAAMDETLQLWPPDVRARREREFEQTQAAAAKPALPQPTPHQP